jgi:hypothetical protein
MKNDTAEQTKSSMAFLTVNRMRLRFLNSAHAEKMRKPQWARNKLPRKLK